MNKKAQFILRNLKREVDCLEINLENNTNDLAYIRLFNIQNHAKRLQNLYDGIGENDEN